MSKPRQYRPSEQIFADDKMFGVIDFIQRHAGKYQSKDYPRLFADGFLDFWRLKGLAGFDIVWLKNAVYRLIIVCEWVWCKLCLLMFFYFLCVGEN